MKLLLFDIDGTLLKPLGVGKKAFLKALQKRYHIETLKEFPFDGLLDMEIVDKSLEIIGVQASFNDKMEILKDYVNHLEEEIPLNFSDYLCPNIPHILDEAKKRNFFLSILTGNIKDAAKIKLKHAQLESYFPVGAYGDDGSKRWQLVDIAIKKSSLFYGKDFSKDKTFLIGDSVRDVEAGKLANVRVVSVATGITPIERLKPLNSFLVIENFYSKFLDFCE